MCVCVCAFVDICGYVFVDIYVSVCGDIYIYVCVYTYIFAYGPVDWDSIPGQVIPKTQKRVLDVSLLNTQYYKVQIKDKWSNPEKVVVLSSTSQCSSY